MGNLRFSVFRLLCTALYVGSLSIAMTSVIYWFSKAVFNTNLNDPIGFSTVLFFFGMLIWILFSTSSSQVTGEVVIQNWFDSKLRRVSLRTRHLFRQTFFRIGVILTVWSLLYGVFGTLAGVQHMFFVDAPIYGVVLVLVSFWFISDRDIALLYLSKFREGKTTKSAGDLATGLNRYNRSTNFLFDSKKLSAIVQYVMAAYRFNMKECRYRIELRLDEIIQFLESRQYGQIPDNLAQLLADCNSFVERYSDLGFKIRYPLWTSLKETTSSSLQRKIPELLFATIILAILVIIRWFFGVQIPISFP